MTEIISVSILIPTYNRGRFIIESIESVIDQLGIDDEIIVIDDGSTDNTKKIIKKYQKIRNFRYIRKEHSNAPDSRNRAIIEAKNPWLLWLDSDDILKEGVVELYKNILSKDSNIDVLYGNMLIFGRMLSKSRKKWIFKDYYNSNDELLSGLIQKNLIPNPGVIVRKSLYERFGFYNTNFIRVHDYEFWSRVALDVRFKNCNKFVVKWRWHDNNMSSPSVYMDLKFEGMVLDSILKKYTLKQIFNNLDWTKEKKAKAKAFLILAKSYKRWSEYNKSLSYLIDALKVDSTNIAYTELLELYYFKLNESERKQIPVSLLHCARENIINVKGRSIKEKYIIASILKKEGKFDLSLSRFLEIQKKVIKNKKYNELLSGVCFHIGEIYLSQKKKKEAKEYFSNSVELNRDHKMARFQLKKIL